MSALQDPKTVAIDGSDRLQMAEKGITGLEAIPIPLKEAVPSYPKLARLMGIVPEMAIFRRFAALNAKMLLYMQAELTHLEDELLEVEKEDSESDENQRKRYSRNARFLHSPHNTYKQPQLVAEIKGKLKEYNKALDLQTRLAGLPRASSGDLDHIQRYLVSPEIVPRTLTGKDSEIWGTTENPESFYPDLVVLRERDGTDSFSKWVRDTGMQIFFRLHGHRWRKPSINLRMVSYSDSTLLKITYWITGILASLLPVLSIVILYSQKSMPVRLATIAIFNVLLTVCLMGFTEARRGDIFSITATFAAVQVVFVGSDNMNARS